jgi:hypothetical protein
MKDREKHRNGSSIVILLIFIELMVLIGCTHEPFPISESGRDNDPPIEGCVSNGEVCFESSVLPIFQSSCAQGGCHDARSSEEGYVLDSYSNITRKGITPGNANSSKLYKVLFESGEDRMPPNSTLSQAQKDSIALWINQGAKNTTGCNCFCDNTLFTYAVTIQPLIANKCSGCHKPGSLSGNIDLSTYTAIKTQAQNGKLLGSITHASGYVPMPEGGKLSDCEITQVEKWITAGMPNN